MLANVSINSASRLASQSQFCKLCGLRVWSRLTKCFQLTPHTEYHIISRYQQYWDLKYWASDASEISIQALNNIYIDIHI